VKAITRDNSRDIGFVVGCLFKQAITLDEMKMWCERLILNCDDYPNYLIDLLDFNGPKAKIFNVIGFVPEWPFDDEKKVALYGIAYRRGVDIYDCPISRESAEELISKEHEILDYFEKEFSFLMS
jgi:hypothetical protein